MYINERESRLFEEDDNESIARMKLSSLSFYERFLTIQEYARHVGTRTRG